MLQELQGADAPAGRESAGLHRGLQGEAAEEEGAQAEDHPRRRRGHRAGPTEQGADSAVAEGELASLLLAPCGSPGAALLLTRLL